MPFSNSVARNKCSALIDGCPMEMETLLPPAVEIATAPEAALGRGSIHRDIQPAIFFVTECGYAKILAGT